MLPLVYVHCGPVVDFFIITKQTSLHPFDFVRNLFHLLYNLLFPEVWQNNYIIIILQAMTFLLCEKFGIKYEEGTIAFKKKVIIISDSTAQRK